MASAADKVASLTDSQRDIYELIFKIETNIGEAASLVKRLENINGDTLEINGKTYTGQEAERFSILVL